MAYIGVPQPSRAITSADIAQGAVTLNDISFTDMPANMDISGTIDKHTMRLAEGVTVTGDITISDNLILSKISDDGVGITLTNDSSTRTITGSGSIEASTLAQTPNASLTGMTGTIGTSVLSTATFEGTLNSSTTFSGDAGKKTAKAWVQFGGASATVADSYNVSSITDRDAGRYTINFMNNMANANYAFSLATTNSSAGQSALICLIDKSAADPTTSSLAIINGYAFGTGGMISGGHFRDTEYISVIIFGD
jgi:hypothetical protein